MSDFIVFNLNTLTTVDTEELPIVSATTRTILNTSTLAKAKISLPNKEASSNNQGDLENAFELAVWRTYEELEPRLRNVNKMLADS